MALVEKGQTLLVKEPLVFRKGDQVLAALVLAFTLVAQALALALS